MEHHVYFGLKEKWDNASGRSKFEAGMSKLMESKAIVFIGLKR